MFALSAMANSSMEQVGSSSGTRLTAGVCLICCARTNEKLMTVSSVGCETLYESARIRGVADLLGYLDANQSEQHFVHQTCRCNFTRHRDLDKIQLVERDGEEVKGQKRKLRSEDGG